MCAFYYIFVIFVYTTVCEIFNYATLKYKICYDYEERVSSASRMNRIFRAKRSNINLSKMCSGVY